MFEKLMIEGGIFHHYQPIYNIQEGKVLGYESLFRNVIELNPEECFFQAKIENRLYELDSRSIYKASTTFQETGYIQDDHKLFLNVFPSTITHPNFLPLITEIIKKNCFKNQQIILEIVESEAVSFPELIKVMDSLKKLGVQTAIDDFGKGSTSLKEIIELQPNFIKMDRYFVQGLKHSKSKKTMIESILYFCQQNHSHLIIEGVEDAIILGFLKKMGIIYAQGYLLGRPSLLAKKKVVFT